MTVLEQLQQLVAKSDDQSVYSLLDDSGIEYEEVEDTTWIDDGKYSYGGYEIKVGDEYFSFSVSRSGSYYSDYYHTIDEVCKYTPDTRYHVTYTFPSQEIAKEFAGWMCCSGEQSMWEWGDLELNREVEYDMAKGTMEIKDKFDI
jgi:hypothetical protein